MELTEKQKDDIGNGRYFINEGVGAPEAIIRQSIQQKESKMSEQKMVTVPETRDLNFRMDPATDLKIVFYTKEAVDRAIKEGLISAREGSQLKDCLSVENLSYPGEAGVVIERQPSSQKDRLTGIPEVDFLSMGVRPLSRGH